MTDPRIDKLIAYARSALERHGFDHTVAFDFGDDGRVRVDGPAGRVDRSDATADCELRVAFEDFLAISEGRLDPAKAYLRGKLEIDGDLGVALEIARRLAAR
jgi:putative sterol carrier protein